MLFASFTSPGPLVFQLGPFALRWYGLLIALAVLTGLLLAMRLGRRRGIDDALIADLLPVLVIGAVLGARSYYVALEWRQYQGHWQDALAIWRGGIAIHGALIGGTIATILFCRWRRQRFWPLLDVLVPAVALGQAIGRWGNFFNSEAFGLPTDLPWKLTIPVANRPSEFLEQATFHPTFLYESLWNLGVCGLLLLLFRQAGRGRIQLPAGALSCVYLMAIIATPSRPSVSELDHTQGEMGGKSPSALPRLPLAFSGLASSARAGQPSPRPRRRHQRSWGGRAALRGG